MRPEPVIQPRNNQHERKHDNSPVHVRRRRVCVDGEEIHHEADSQKHQCHIVDQPAPIPQRPAAQEQWLATDMLQVDTADGGDGAEQESGVE